MNRSNLYPRCGVYSLEKNRMRSGRPLFVILIIFLTTACTQDEEPGGFEITTYSYDFSESDFSWQGGFSDFPADALDSAYELKYEYTHQPESSQNSLMISGNNHSDDLFMYVKKHIDGLSPNTVYTLTYEVEFASEAQKGTVGAGGAPGESVFLKVGATEIEPKSVVEGEMYTMNIDKGNQAESGEDMVKIGDISVPEGSSGFELTSRSNSPYDMNSSYHQPIYVKSNSNGELWLIVGTDSGYEGVTTLFYTKITAVLSKSR
jgi:hypothetical protein